MSGGKNWNLLFFWRQNCQDLPNVVEMWEKNLKLILGTNILGIIYVFRHIFTIIIFETLSSIIWPSMCVFIINAFKIPTSFFFKMSTWHRFWGHMLLLMHLWLGELIDDMYTCCFSWSIVASKENWQQNFATMVLTLTL